MSWISQPNDRASMNGRPVLLVRERNAAGAGVDPICAVFMNRDREPGLLDAEGHAQMIAQTPRMADFIAMLFENGCTIAPEDRTVAMQEAMAIHGAITGEHDRYRYPPDEDDDGVGEAGDEEAAA
jgi:hypothetical protein